MNLKLQLRQDFNFLCERTYFVFFFLYFVCCYRITKTLRVRFRFYLVGNEQRGFSATRRKVAKAFVKETFNVDIVGNTNDEHV